jgi:hypothetical protein
MRRAVLHARQRLRRPRIRRVPKKTIQAANAASLIRIVREFRPPPERHQVYIAHDAKTLVDHGLTSAFSGGATRPAIEVAVRDDIAGGRIAGPRLKASSFERSISARGGRMFERDALASFVADMVPMA